MVVFFRSSSASARPSRAVTGGAGKPQGVRAHRIAMSDMALRQRTLQYVCVGKGVREYGGVSELAEADQLGAAAEQALVTRNVLATLGRIVFGGQYHDAAVPSQERSRGDNSVAYYVCSNCEVRHHVGAAYLLPHEPANQARHLEPEFVNLNEAPSSGIY